MKLFNTPLTLQRFVRSGVGGAEVGDSHVAVFCLLPPSERRLKLTLSGQHLQQEAPRGPDSAQPERVPDLINAHRGHQPAQLAAGADTAFVPLGSIACQL